MPKTIHYVSVHNRNKKMLEQNSGKIGGAMI